jgi:hypothetical protein
LLVAVRVELFHTELGFDILIVARACNAPVERCKVFIGFACTRRVNSRTRAYGFDLKRSNSTTENIYD